MSADECSNSFESGPSHTNSSGASAMLTSLPVPSTEFRYPSSGERTTENSPSLNHMAAASSNAHLPLHLSIGEENEESAEGYAIPPLDDDFLTGQQRMQQPSPFHPAEQLGAPSAVPRRPQKFSQLMKRRSAEFPLAFSTPPAAAPSSVFPAGWPAASGPTSTPVPNGPPAGMSHRRSASHGNPTEIWTGITQHQQSMPCIANLPGESTSFNKLCAAFLSVGRCGSMALSNSSTYCAGGLNAHGVTQ